MPYAASRRVSSVRVEVGAVGVLHQRPAHDLAGRDQVDLGGVGRGAVGGAQPDGVLDDLGERPDRRLDRGVGRHGAAPRGGAGDVGDPQQLGHALGAEEGRHQRLVGLLPHRGEDVGDVLAGDVERRDVDGDHGVDLGVVDRAVERVLEVLGGRLGVQRDLLVDDQADGRGGVRGEQAEGVRVADDRDPAAARQRLVGEQLGDVEHVVQRVDLDHAGLPEHRVHGLRRRRDLADRVTHRHTLRRPPGPDRDDRLAQRDPAGDPRELARVADRLEVHHHDLGRVVLLPVLQEVVAGDVGAVAGADERREPEPPVADLLEDGGAQGTGLAEEAGPAARRHHPGERRVQRHRGIGVDDAERVGADEAQAVGAGQPDQPSLPLPPLLTRLGEAGGDDDQAVHALGRAVEHHVGHRVGGDGHDRHVDVVGDVADRLVRRHAGHRRRARVDRVDPTGEVAGDQVADQRLADRVLAATGADHRHRARVEEPVDRGGLGLVLAAPHRARPACRWGRSGTRG